MKSNTGLGLKQVTCLCTTCGREHTARDPHYENAREQALAKLAYCQERRHGKPGLRGWMGDIMAAWRDFERFRAAVEEGRRSIVS